MIAAVSQQPDLSFMEGEPLTLPFTRWQTLESHPETMHSGHGNLFAIGNLRRGPATAIEAVADGRKAALAIDQFLHGDMIDPVRPFNACKAPTLKLVDPAQFAHLKQIARSIMPHLAVAEREGSFAEVEHGLSDADARNEASRCLECGCQANTNCALRDYATEYKVEQSALDTSQCQKFAVDNSSEFIVFDANRCIGCGQCVQACGEQAVQGVLRFAKNNDGTSRTGRSSTRDSRWANPTACSAVPVYRSAHRRPGGCPRQVAGAHRTAHAGQYHLHLLRGRLRCHPLCR